MNAIITAASAMSVLGASAGIGLALAAKFFAVEEDPMVAKILDVLPGANCGGCGFAGCEAYATQIQQGKASISLCIPGGKAIADKIAEISGQLAVDVETRKVMVRCCQDNTVKSPENMTCAQAHETQTEGCLYGCLGQGDCVSACKFGAMTFDDEGKVRIDTSLCVGCGACAEVCPRHLIALMPDEPLIYVACASREKGGVVRKMCATGCIGCKKCTKVCETGAITVENFLASIDVEKCTRCGVCLENCPTHCLTLFDPEGKAAHQEHGNVA